MKAVILAGGRGERLRPITDTRPKPLVPVLARPVMDYCLSLLSHHGIKKAFVTTHYLAHQIRHRYGNRAFDISLSYLLEEEPLGTCGGVKLLEKEFLGEECFLVMSGDALCDFDLGSAIQFHKEKKADVTVILSSVKTPLEYGVVLQDTMERIFAFSEKPDWSETLSDLANTGIYILSPGILKEIPEGKAFDFAHDLFPHLIRKGYALFGYKDDGYWCDIGKISSLYRCNLDVMHGKAKTYLSPCGRVEKSGDGEGVCFISHTATISPGATVKNGSVISPGAHLEEGASVSGSVVLEDVKVKKGAQVKDAFLCERCRIGQDSLVLPDSVLGAGSVTLSSSSSERGKKYPPGTVISRTPVFAEEGLVFTEEGAAQGEGPGLDATGAQKLGYALGKYFSGGVGILWDEKEKGSSYFATSLAGGLQKAGQKALLLFEGAEEMASFAASTFCMPVVFVSQSRGKGIFFVFGKEGMPLLRGQVLKLSRYFEDPQTFSGGELFTRSDVPALYEDALSEKMGRGEKIRVGLSGNFYENLKNAAIKSGFDAYHGVREKGLCLEVFHRELKVFFDGERLADTEKARLFVLEQELQGGRRYFCLPRSAPRYFAEHIEMRGGKTEFFTLGHTVGEETKERAFGRKDRFLYDSAFLGAYILALRAKLGEEKFKKELSQTPEIYISSLPYQPAEEVKARLLGSLGPLSGTRMKVRLQPGFFGMKIISEATSFEAALDNAFEYRGKLNEIEEKLRGK